MHTYKKSALILLVLILLFEITVAVYGDISTRKPWGDEIRLYASVLNFGEGITLDLITHYRQMSTPLPFIIYAGWGHLFGFDLFTLRILSIIIALLTYMLFHRILFQQLKKKSLAVIGTLLLVVHPYMVGLSIFVFTDMPAILFLLLGYYTLQKKKFYLSALFIALSILCRQYILFFLPPMFIYYALQYRETKSIHGMVASILPALPYFLLVLLWGGTSPDNEYRALYLNEQFSFHIDNFFLYVSLLFLYLFPFYFFTIKRFFAQKKILSLSFVLSLLYYFYPIQPSVYSQDIGVYTVGLFHKALKYMINSDTAIQVIFYISVIFGLTVLLTFIKEIYISFQKKEHNQTFFLNLIILFFFIVMPFSYLGWEKYFMPILPFVILRLLIIIDQKTTHTLS